MNANEENEGRHYLAVKTLFALLHGIKYKGDFYSLNCLHSFRIENLSLMKKYVEIKISGE